MRIYSEFFEITYASRTCDRRRSPRPIRHKQTYLSEPLRHQDNCARLPAQGDRRAERALSGVPLSDDADPAARRSQSASDFRSRSRLDR